MGSGTPKSRTPLSTPKAPLADNGYGSREDFPDDPSRPSPARPSLESLAERARSLRREIIQMIATAGSGHPGGSLSTVDILLVLYSCFLRHRGPENPDFEDRDRFILSKGHGAPALYAVLAEFGYLSKEEMGTLRKLGSRLQGHPDKRFLPILEASTGSLGQGLSVGVGMALAARLDKKSYRTYVLIGDGESEEGQIWEAAMSAAYRKLDNLTAIVDVNGIQLDGFTRDILNLEPLAPKWESFGWFVQEIDGHDLRQIHDALSRCSTHRGQPSVIIARTVKGKGASEMENNPAFHGRAPNPDETARALRDLA
ncbi:MAG: transketolase [Candidatus Tectomicrobia bacterium]|nr:transketolase [Candidatus Tectomicrobia bacterium]